MTDAIMQGQENGNLPVVGMDIHQILRLLPHRYPFLLVDKVLACKPNESIVALKNVTYNEPFFTGHFPQRPIMPGVLILEAMAQATGLLAFYSRGENPEDGTLYMLVGVDRARFKQPVGPGDQLIVDVRLDRRIRDIYRFTATATVADRVVSTAEFMTTKQVVTD
jgi:3-hydroxyacyl-[acyl-carrier-protein] dehydratase